MITDKPTRLLEEAKANAPSFVRLRHDGVDLKCANCGVRDRGKFMRVWTLVNSKIVHEHCVRGTFLKNAKDMGVW